MVDRELERKLKGLKEFMQLWVKFHDFYKGAISRETISPEEENTFQETKALIEKRYHILRGSFEAGFEAGLPPHYTFDMISQVLSLKSLAAISDLNLDKIETAWNNSYVQLNKLLGELEIKQQSLRKVSRLKLIIKSADTNLYAKIILAAIIILSVWLLINFFHKASRLPADVKYRAAVRHYI